MKLMTESELADFLKNHCGSEFVSVTTSTEPRMNVKNRETRELNPYLGRIRRFAVRPGMIGASYENAVQNRRESEGHKNADAFDALSLWNGAGEHVSNALVRHKTTNRLFMVFYPRHDEEGTVKISESQWMLDEKPVTMALIQPYLPPCKEGSERQETVRSVPWRVIGLDSIVSITMHGETYTITH